MGIGTKSDLKGWELYTSVIDLIHPMENDNMFDVVRSYPGSEVHGGTTVEKQCSHVDIAIVCSNVQRGEATL